VVDDQVSDDLVAVSRRKADSEPRLTFVEGTVFPAYKGIHRYVIRRLLCRVRGGGNDSRVSKAQNSEDTLRAPPQLARAEVHHTAHIHTAVRHDIVSGAPAPRKRSGEGGARRSSRTVLCGGLLMEPLRAERHSGGMPGGLSTAARCGRFGFSIYGGGGVERHLRWVRHHHRAALALQSHALKADRRSTRQGERVLHPC
jgi:hypothetical protein